MRVITRILIRLRWPMAIAAVLAIGATALSRWAFVGCFIHAASWHRHLGITMAAGSVDFRHYSDRTDMDTLQFRFENTGAWHWAPYTKSYPAQDLLIVAVPMWAISLVPLALSVAGFRAKRREPRLGECTACRHLLHGAAVCPECGHKHLAVG